MGQHDVVAVATRVGDQEAHVAERDNAPFRQSAEGAGDRIDPKKMNVRALAAGDDVKAPWHFKVLIALVVLYLTWRVVQLVGMLF